MQENGQNIYANFKLQPNSSKEYGNTLNVLCLGYAGHGKTTLYNKLCKQCESVGFAFQSVTLKVTHAQCIHLQNNQIMNIYDSPGIIQQSIKGIDEIIKQLKQTKWNLITIVCKFEAPYAINTIPNIKRFIKLIKTVTNNQKLILIMVSHSDTINAQNEQEFLQQFNNNLKNNGILHNVIVFSNVNSDVRVLSQLIYYCASQNISQMSVKLSVKDFQRCLGCRQSRKNESLIQYINIGDKEQDNQQSEGFMGFIKKYCNCHCQFP